MDKLIEAVHLANSIERKLSMHYRVPFRIVLQAEVRGVGVTTFVTHQGDTMTASRRVPWDVLEASVVNPLTSAVEGTREDIENRLQECIASTEGK